MAGDVRIGGHFLFPGVGFGGSCFPKDLAALQHTGEEAGVPMRVLAAVGSVNRDQKRVLVEKVRAHFGGDLEGRTFALWGLAFKPGTDDMREAPALEIVKGLAQAGARVRAHDPVARGAPGAEVGDDPYAILEGADGLLLVTEWNAYRSPDFERIRDLLKTKVVFDGRNIWERGFVESFGLSYYGIGV
jgi:UDPglucose 6-dehydrogenase